MSFSIDGKTVIVTGAANGIGAALARHFAENGAHVMCADIDEKALKKDLGESADDSNVRYFAGDLREKLTLANLLSATVDAFDRVDVQLTPLVRCLLQIHWIWMMKQWKNYYSKT